jgi:hypothetical protein
VKEYNTGVRYLQVKFGNGTEETKLYEHVQIDERVLADLQEMPTSWISSKMYPSNV